MNTSRITLNIQTSSKTGKSLEGYFSSNYLKKLENELMILEKLSHFINGTIMFDRNYPPISLNVAPLLTTLRDRHPARFPETKSKNGTSFVISRESLIFHFCFWILFRKTRWVMVPAFFITFPGFVKKGQVPDVARNIAPDFNRNMAPYSCKDPV